MYFLGVDTSTTSSKALLIDKVGNVVAVASNPHTLQTPRPLWSEQDSREWWQAVAAGIRSVLEKAGIGGERVGAGAGHTSPRFRRRDEGCAVASVLNVELATVNTTEGGAYGAALLAGVGAGQWQDVAEACSACIKITGSTQPVEVESEAYRKSYDVYRGLYPALQATFMNL